MSIKLFNYFFCLNDVLYNIIEVKLYKNTTRVLSHHKTIHYLTTRRRHNTVMSKVKVLRVSGYPFTVEILNIKNIENALVVHIERAKSLSKVNENWHDRAVRDLYSKVLKPGPIWIKQLTLANVKREKVCEWNTKIVAAKELVKRITLLHDYEQQQKHNATEEQPLYYHHEYSDVCDFDPIHI
jgi:hypothetical protein